ncbi:MAG: hypothetical protein HY903_04130 [Deltaproteobacteria bacterium]|nr:hypothetical protein [Deltaproteobacteria bacterium]
MVHATDSILLSDDDLAFFRLTCDLFPAPESPLRYLEDGAHEPADLEQCFGSLKSRNLLNPAGAGAASHVADRLTPVSECSARVTLSVKGVKAHSRSFYLAGNTTVEYRKTAAGHAFGPPRTEGALAVELSQLFKTGARRDPLQVRMSAGDYLVFAVFARDLRAAPKAATGPEAPMSVEEVLAYFDEPESKVVRTPTDDAWEKSIVTLTRLGVLERKDTTYSLQRRWHPVACEIVADHQHVISRHDYLDEQWLVREVSLYPTSSAVFRLGTANDGSVAIEELTATTLANVVAGVIGTLPNLLNPEAPPSLKHPMLGTRAPQSR